MAAAAADTVTQPSLAKPLEAKRESLTVVDVLAAEDVGEFPDREVAEAMQRICGVSIAREFSERERVSIRGMARSFSYLMLPI